MNNGLDISKTIRGKLRLNGAALLLAEQLIRYGARPSFVKQFIPLSDRAMRHIYRSVWHQSSPRGRYRQNIEEWWIESGWSRRLTGGLFYSIYAFYTIHNPILESVDRIWSFTSAYGAYQARCKALRMECAGVEMCWQLLLKIDQRELVIRRCRSCHALYVMLPLTFNRERRDCLYCVKDRGRSHPTRANIAHPNPAGAEESDPPSVSEASINPELDKNHES
ncbi:MAG: FlhC family transcriptional regulator [Gammaproteobacteria bacterium]